MEVDEPTARHVAAALSMLGRLPAELAAAKIRTAMKSGAVLQLQPRELDAVLEASSSCPLMSELAARPGVPLALTITDKDGGVGSASGGTLAIYDPTTFVNGSGWIAGPTGNRPSASASVTPKAPPSQADQPRSPHRA